MTEIAESQTFQIWVVESKADAVFEIITTKLREAKQAGNIISASCIRSKKEVIQIE